MFKVNNKDTRTTPGVLYCSVVLLYCCSVCIVNFEQVNAGWEIMQRVSKLAANQIAGNSDLVHASKKR